MFFPFRVLIQSISSSTSHASPAKFLSRRETSQMRRIQCTHLDIPRPPIQIDMQILHLPILPEHVLQVLLAGLFVHIGYENDPALDRADGDCAGGGAGFSCCGGGGLGFGSVHVDILVFGCHYGDGVGGGVLDLLLVKWLCSE